MDKKEACSIEIWLFKQIYTQYGMASALITFFKVEPLGLVVFKRPVCVLERFMDALTHCLALSYPVICSQIKMYKCKLYEQNGNN